MRGCTPGLLEWHSFLEWRRSEPQKCLSSPQLPGITGRANCYSVYLSRDGQIPVTEKWNIQNQTKSASPLRQITKYHFQMSPFSPQRRHNHPHHVVFGNHSNDMQSGRTPNILKYEQVFYSPISPKQCFAYFLNMSSHCNVGLIAESMSWAGGGCQQSTHHQDTMLELVENYPDNYVSWCFTMEHKKCCL